MESPNPLFIACFLCLLIFLYILRSSLAEKDRSKIIVSTEFKTFQRSYLLVFLIMMGADWLQGPYVYELYRTQYAYSETEIGQLFVVGFGTSMLFGGFVGSAADKYGRKKLCIVYALLYSGCCWTKHSPDFHVLMFGRFLGGISTSILFSAFESWMIHEHHSKSFPNEWLSETFATATTLNGFVAIFAGVLGGLLVDNFGLVAPFDASWMFLFMGGGAILMLWGENYGDQQAPILATLKEAGNRMFHDPRILLIGCIQSLFESAMYIFVFKWTPALGDVPHGWVFASFMTAVMLGSTIFSYLVRTGHKIERFLIGVFVMASVSLLVPVFVSPTKLEPGVEDDAITSLNTKVTWLRFASFLVFEACVGVFWPSICTMRGSYVPEEVRATLMNFFRIPLNIIVVFVLYQKRAEQETFWICTGLLCLAACFQFWLKNITVDSAGKLGEEGSKEAPVDEESEETPLVN
uniref:Molybdate-anion transporter n=1 Tax=Hirondellea gigas TaxID=1518452 RepID=A0A6A7FX43_9CRUS